MRVLAASQQGDVALESATLQHGILTYALVEKGLGEDAPGKWRADLNQDGVVTIEEWLRYAALETPRLYDDISANRLQSKGAVRLEITPYSQVPVLFDFGRLPATFLIRSGIGH
jgi:hypothetical protein